MFNRNVPTNLMQRGNRATGEFAKMLTYPFNSTHRDLFHLLIFSYFLPGADGAELFSLLIGLAAVVLSHPQMENPNAVHTHKQDSVCHQLKKEDERKER